MESSSSSSDDDSDLSTSQNKSNNHPRSITSSSSNNESPTSSEGLKIRPKTHKTSKKSSGPTSRRELKRAIEKKFRLRYTSLQLAYEQRLEVLAARVQDAVNQVQEDASIHCLQDNALTSEYASARLAEVVQECFYGERERYIKAMSDQIAWQASDLRESQQKLRVVQKRETDAQRQWKLAQRDIQALYHQLDVRVQEIQDQKKREMEFKMRFRAVIEEREAAKREIEVLKPNVQSLKTLQQEHDALTLQMQRDGEQSQNANDELLQRIKSLEEATSKLELEKQASQQETIHLKHLLTLSESKLQEVTQTLQQLQREDYPSKVARLNAELAHQQQMTVLAKKDHEDLKRRYEEFGVQVEQYMNEQTHERAALITKGEEQVKQLQDQLETAGRQAQDALKTKQAEATRVVDQLKFRQEVFAKAEKKIASLEERGAALESQQVEAKLRHEKHVGTLEREIVQWKHALEKEQEKVASLQTAIAEIKERYECKLASVQDAMNRQNRQGAYEKELESRTRWQNEFVAKQDARIEELKEKYDRALEKQQAELLGARQMALETANSAAVKWEQDKIARKEEEEIERRRRSEDANRDKERKEEQRALQLEQRRMQQEFDERVKRLLEREKALLEKEKRDDRRRLEEARKASSEAAAAAAASVPTQAQAATPSVVVLNMSSVENDEDSDQRLKRNAVIRVDTANRRQRGTSEKVLWKQESCDDSIPLAQHAAELQAAEAQSALRAEERVQKLMQEFQERKEAEFRAAMVNVRKGIQKLELSLEETKAEKKRAEEQLLSERQAFVGLKHEFEESKDAKRTVLQRLEEANENLGKLRTVVRDLQSKCQSMEDQCKVAVVEKDKSEDAAVASQQECERLREHLARVTDAATRLESSLDTSVESNEQSKKELLDRIAVLGHQLIAREEHFKLELLTVQEQNAHTLRNESLEYEAKLSQLQQSIDAAQQEHLKEQSKANELEISVRELTAAKNSLQSIVEQTKAESARQRKEFADLSRMHKNLTETMNTRVGAASESLEEERLKRIAAEARSLQSEKLAERIKSDKEKCLNVYRLKLQQLAHTLKEVRKDATNEISMGWEHLRKEVTLAGVEWRKRTDTLLQSADAVWQRKAKADKQEWKKVIARKDKEMESLLSSQRVNDQSKYDQVVERFERKSRELEELDAQLGAQADLNSSLQQTIQKLEEEQQHRSMELSRLQELLSVAQIATQKQTEETERVRTMLETRDKRCEVFRTFVASLAKTAGTDFATSVLDEPQGDKVRSAGDSRQLSDELEKLTVRLQKAQVQAIDNAIAKATVSTTEGVSMPLVTELEAAKKALKFLWDEHNSHANDDEYDDHLPWYLRAVKAVKRERGVNERTVSVFRQDLASTEAEKQEVLRSRTKWQEANNLLRFEKDTILREMDMLQQTMQKRKEQELDELRSEYDVRIEQLKQRHDRAIKKIDQDNETSMNQLRDMLEAERRSTSHVKNEVIELRMALERTEEELKEVQHKLDKETEELQETVSKWKRKAKLAMKGGGIATSSKAALRMSSSSHGTEEDSDASYRVMYPYSRRASNAMADLSNLMEQSLVSIRKEAVVPQLSPRRNR
ncbi:hypothetical protein PHYBOEH_006262 [Phytophthora boehmeriae]|uniref:Uncharacterized protein n=1 Tax=Phytophthora boehmeriae TaxID=109152 RepID=A0A8T1X251_9STRA|nr:hypothetical protein PHYBOEH_006262 [Phytophthora boehmeriae]